MSESFLDGKVTLHCGDMLEILETLDPNSVDSCVCDPPYHLTSIVKRFGANNAAPAKIGKTGAYSRASAGFMGKQWDGGDIAFRPETWAKVYRALKPGAHLVAFSGTRTYHRMACAIEDAGFEVRDMIAWMYGSGFPKSHDVSKGIDKALGAERSRVRVDASQVRNPKATGAGRDDMEGATRPWIESAIERGFHEAVSDEAVSDEAVEWQGWGTALKPALEPIILARKPLSEKTIAANVLRWGTGALNIDGTRIGTRNVAMSGPNYGRIETGEITIGRWPANVAHDGSAEVVDGFPHSESSRSVVTSKPGAISVNGAGLPSHTGEYGFDDSGSAARYFYTAKADGDDRLGSKHPTVKPLDLMQWLVRLVTPVGGLVLDPFAGTGPTAQAAVYERMRAILIEREPEYQEDIRRRMRLAYAGPVERRGEVAKTKPQEPEPMAWLSGLPLE